tara:strand:- start:199 stop:1218 length:1020 start_codon:yes stop_codon:yes gene_type:complete
VKISAKIAYTIITFFIFQQLLNAAEVNIYSARKEALIKPLLEKFSEKTGVEVNLITGKADTFIKRLEIEGENTPADILLTVDAARLVRAKQKGLFQEINSEVLNKVIADNLRDINNHWFGLSIRSRVIVFSPKRVGVEDLIDYQDLSNAKWRGRICVRSSSNIYNQSLVASMIAHYGIDKTEIWAKGFVKNFARPPKGGDRDQIKAIAAGVCDIALVNNYYLAGMLDSGQLDEISAAMKTALFWPGQNKYGAHVNISGAGVTKFSKNKTEAIQLLEYLVSSEAQEWYSNVNYEYSVNPKIKNSGVLKKWGTFISDDINLSLLGNHNSDAVLIMDRAGWK